MSNDRSNRTIIILCSIIAAAVAAITARATVSFIEAGYIGALSESCSHAHATQAEMDPGGFRGWRNDYHAMVQKNWSRGLETNIPDADEDYWSSVDLNGYAPGWEWCYSLPQIRAHQ